MRARFVVGMQVVNEEGRPGVVLESGTDSVGDYVLVQHPGHRCTYSPNIIRPNWTITDPAECVDVPVAFEE